MLKLDFGKPKTQLPPGVPVTQNLPKKEPEMNELDPVKKSLKIWAHNSS